MGLIKAGLGALGGNLADQWKEYFVCDSLSADCLVKKGEKKAGGRSSNTKGTDNHISNGSIITVNVGQCAIIVSQGKIYEVAAEPGDYTYNSETQPSIFAGSLGQSVLASFKDMWTRFTFGGEPAIDTRIYYFNTKEIVDNKFGTVNPIPFRIYDANINLDLDTAVRCSGIYTYKITDPVLFYSNVCSNISDAYYKSEIENTLKTEFTSALQPVFAKMSTAGMRPSMIPAHADQLCDLMNEALTAKWSALRGISIVSVSMNPLVLPEEDQTRIKNAQTAAINRDPSMAMASLVGSGADSMRDAAKNENGAMMGFMGMGMAMNQTANMMSQLAGVNFQAPPRPAQGGPIDLRENSANQASQQQAPVVAQNAASSANDGWFCTECGAKNGGKFCSNCGTKRPAGAPLYRCDKCGFEPADPKNPPKFCPECGDKFTDDDIV